MLDRILGLLRVRVIRGVNLAVRDVRSSDPYVVLRMGKQEVYDKDTFSADDPMGNAEFSIEPFFEVVKKDLGDVSNGIVLGKVLPNRQNCLAEESVIRWANNKVVQDMVLRLRNVECGEIELQLQWIDIPITKVAK
ncbi:hypothetical protein HPP92_023535 [Vanilla planifolia]|uniref:C2 domain-containing protein n=1 Tax=Vanilla planifolia TaxID=51239 RepID=A0A835PQH1_VANPL|nr:hypothetical protein HPP92_023810 [Vanilla planifolia]KAG0455747.1 hypothetical protein HPP92_023535 [Vanilla planifolia]